MRTLTTAKEGFISSRYVWYSYLLRKKSKFQAIRSILYCYLSVPLQTWSGPESSRKLRLPDFVTTAQDGGKVVSLTHRSPFNPWNTPGSYSVRGWATPGPSCYQKDFMSMKIPLTPAGIEPATFRFVAQHLNHCVTAVLSYYAIMVHNF